MIEEHFDIPFVARMAKREKQIQQNYRPVIGVHKWFARRPGTLFRALLLAEFGVQESLATDYFKSHDLSPRIVGDPFMGGGTPLLEANRLGCHVVGSDVNPMAYWIVRQELAELDRSAFHLNAQEVISIVDDQVGDLYKTTCTYCGNLNAEVKYFLWVKQQLCANCARHVDLFSNYIVAKNERHPNYVLVCPGCGSLNEVKTLDRTPGAMQCQNCQGRLLVDGPARRNKCQCSHCGYQNAYPAAAEGPPTHRLFAVEYHCDECRSTHAGRYFKAPDEADRMRIAKAERCCQAFPLNYVPDDLIPEGDETTRLHRWGYESYRQLFNSRQLLGLNILVSAIGEVGDESVRQALLTVFSDTLRYQNMLCRYDSYALKIIDIFSVHGFPVSLIQCENSLLGIKKIGSGAFRHFVDKYDRAKAYCERPFEIYPGKGKRRVVLPQERIGAKLVDSFPAPGDVPSAYLQAVSSDRLILPKHGLDAVLTDPPYYANVQYAELMDFCYVWLRKHLANTEPAFRSRSTRTSEELTVNQTEGRDIYHWAEGLSRVFVDFTNALKPGAPFAFTYHHNDIRAYFPIAVALLDAGLVCTSALPCPAEMGASIHINGTGSSVMDSILVCRTSGTIRTREFEATEEGLKHVLAADLAQLRLAGLKPTMGDTRCLLFGHLTRLAVWQLRVRWTKTSMIQERIRMVESGMQEILALDRADRFAGQLISSPEDYASMPLFQIAESQNNYDDQKQISF